MKAYYVVFAPLRTTLVMMVRATGAGWTIEECFAIGKAIGPEDYEVRGFTAWYTYSNTGREPGEANARSPSVGGLGGNESGPPSEAAPPRKVREHPNRGGSCGTSMRWRAEG